MNFLGISRRIDKKYRSVSGSGRSEFLAFTKADMPPNVHGIELLIRLPKTDQEREGLTVFTRLWGNPLL